MRSPSVLFVSLLCGMSSLVAARRTTIYTFDPHSDASNDLRPGKLSPVAARLVLAQRAGVEDYHDADLLEPTCLEAINKYGSKTPLLEMDDSTGLKHVFILTEIQHVLDDSYFFREQMRSAMIADAPAALDLFLDLARQRSASPLGSDSGLKARLSEGLQTLSKNHIFFLADSMPRFSSIVDEFLKDGTVSVTAVVTDRADADAEDPLRWGTYRMPGSASLLKKREQKETPLAAPTTKNPAVHEAPIHALANSTTVRGILPACFTSQSQCERNTYNCSGHGICKLAYHDRDAKAGDCYSCKCGNTTSADGKVTTFWGGPACQKKDVSVQFWLITLFTVGLVFLIGFAVGQIWEMGEQPLPSVIGAGVSGPTARK